MAAGNQPTSSNFFLFFYFILLFYTLSLPWCLQAPATLSSLFLLCIFSIFSSLLDSLSPVTLSSLLFLYFFFPFTLYPSLLDSDCLQQPSPLCIFSTFFFPYPSLLDSNYLQQLSLIFRYFLFLYFPFLKLIASLNF